LQGRYCSRFYDSVPALQKEELGKNHKNLSYNFSVLAEVSAVHPREIYLVPRIFASLASGVVVEEDAVVTISRSEKWNVCAKIMLTSLYFP
jgi:hypothetical protein